MKILFLTNLLPYPLDNGGKIKTYTTLKSLSEAGHDIDLLCFKETKKSVEENELEVLKLCRTVKQVYLPLTTADHKKYMVGVAIKSVFSTLPFSIYKYQSEEMLQELSVKKCVGYDVVYFDHLPMCRYLCKAQNFWPTARIVNRKSYETQNYLKKIFLKLEAFKLGKFEALSIKKVNKTVVLSKTDYESLKLLINQDFEHNIIPIGVPDRGIKKDNENEKLNILFIGTLTWEPNNSGLIWFLKEVLPIVDKKNIDYHFYIVGKNPSKEVKCLCETYKSKITVTGYVESVDEYYDKCACTIVPLFVGSGQRVKLIEAFSKGMPAISTTIGAEGLEYINDESIIIADDKERFAEAIVHIQEKSVREKLKINSRKIYDSFYSAEIITDSICKSIEG